MAGAGPTRFTEREHFDASRSEVKLAILARLRTSSRFLALLGLGGTACPTGYVLGQRVRLRATASDRVEAIAVFNSRLEGRLTGSGEGGCDLEYGISAGPGLALAWVFGIAALGLFAASAVTTSIPPLLLAVVPAAICVLLLIARRAARPVHEAEVGQLKGFLRELRSDLAQPQGSD